MRKVFAGSVLLVGLLLALPASALQSTLVIELGDQIVNMPGTHTIYDEPTPGDLIGLTCSASVTAVNNESIHPNNDMIVTSGGSSVTIFNYESVANGTFEADGDLTLGDRILIQVVLPGGTTSDVFDLVLTCAQPPPPTTTTAAPPPPTTTAPATTTTGGGGDVTTTESPPTGGVEAGGGGTAANPAAPWVGGGALLLAAALATAAAARTLIARKD